jgi:predicted dehydrogenase
MFMHNPRLNRVRRALDDGKTIGRIKRITSSFSFYMDETFDQNIRLDSRLEPAGCLGDLGWYCIRFALWAMNWRLPREVTGRILAQRGGQNSPAPVPVDFSGELIFDRHTSAGFYCSFLAGDQNWAYVSGAEGWLRMDDFVRPFNDHESAFVFNQKEIRVPTCDCGAGRCDRPRFAQPTSMIRNFSNQIRSGKLNPDWPMWSLKTQRVMDACFASARNALKR